MGAQIRIVAPILFNSSQNGHNRGAVVGTSLHTLKLHNFAKTLADTVAHAHSVKLGKDIESK